MGTEQKANSLGRLTAQNLKLLLEQSQSLTGEIAKAISNNNSPDQIPEMTAALQFTEDTSRLARNMIEVHGEVIFSRDEIDPHEVTEPSPAPNAQPKAFANLLIGRIDQQLLPQSKTTFTLQEIKDISGNVKGFKRAQSLAGFTSEKNSLSREEAIQILKILLTTSLSEKKRREKYSRINMIQLFTSAPKLDILSREIDFPWEKDTEIDHDTAMQIRGLVQLDKILSRRGKPDTLQLE